MNRGISRFGLAALAIGYAFLYAPILSMVAYSFNDNRLASVWGHFSFQAYGQLLADSQLRSAALLSLEIGLLTGLSATVREQIEALRRAGGDAAVALIRREPDAKVLAIVEGWAERFEARQAAELGFTAEQSMDEIVHIHLEDELDRKP